MSAKLIGNVPVSDGTMLAWAIVCELDFSLAEASLYTLSFEFMTVTGDTINRAVRIPVIVQ